MRSWMRAALMAVGFGVLAADLGDLGLWRGALRLGPTSAEAAARGDRIAGLLRALAVGLQVDPETSAWLKDLRASMLELDLKRTWMRLPVVDGERRYVYVSGKNLDAGGYALRLGAQAASRPTGLGDIAGQAGLQPQSWQNDPAYVTQGRVSMLTAPLGHAELRAVLAEVLRALGSAGDEAALQHRLRADFPHLFAVVDRYLTLRSIGRPGPEGTLLIDLSVAVDPDRLATAGYPALGRFVRRLGDVADLSVSVVRRTGHLATMWVRSPGQYGVQMAIHEGRVVPVRGQSVDWSGAVDFETLSSLDLALRPRGVIRLKGTRLSVENWTVPLSVRASSSSLVARTRLSTMPSVDFRSDGGFGGFVVASAGNALGLEQQATRYFQSIAEGSDGAGGALSVTVDSESISGEWDVLMLDNLVVRFAAEVMGQRVLPDDTVLDELLALEASISGALAADWAAIRPRIVAAQFPPG